MHSLLYRSTPLQQMDCVITLMQNSLAASCQKSLASTTLRDAEALCSDERSCIKCVQFRQLMLLKQLLQQLVVCAPCDKRELHQH